MPILGQPEPDAGPTVDSDVQEERIQARRERIAARQLAESGYVNNILFPLSHSHLLHLHILFLGNERHHKSAQTEYLVQSRSTSSFQRCFDLLTLHTRHIFYKRK